MTLIRQGDVLLIPVASIPEEASEITPASGRVVLKHGEATGHTHVIDAPSTKVRIWDVGAERFLQVMEAVMLRHEEHSTVEIPPGIYHMPDQVEWTDANDVRTVSD